MKYLKQNGTENDTVAIPYGDLPLKFYTKMRIIGARSDRDWSRAKEADFIILRKYAMVEKEHFFMKDLISNVNWNNYQEIIIDYPDIHEQNREEPSIHHFRTVTDENRVIIFKKIKRPKDREPGNESVNPSS